MKFKFIFNIPVNRLRDVDLRGLLNDALAEFIGEREPAEAFVAKRYPDGYCGDHRRDNEKIQEVTNRLIAAQAMRATLDTPDTEECDADDDCPTCPHLDVCQDAHDWLAAWGDASAGVSRRGR